MAKNDYGEQLDRNGYAPSIMHQQVGCCYLCGKYLPTYRHEIFHGPYRKKSKQFGLWVNLCLECHCAVHGASKDRRIDHRKLDRELKESGQKNAEIYYGWDHDDFRLIFGRNYESSV